MVLFSARVGMAVSLCDLLAGLTGMYRYTHDIGMIGMSDNPHLTRSNGRRFPRSPTDTVV
jgi:hypothetical protein